MKKQRIRLPRRDGLVGEWLLNGNANDTSGNGNNGTPTNVPYSKTDMGYQTYKGYFAGGSSSKLFVASGFPVLSNTFTVQVLIENTNLSQTGTYVYEKGNYYYGNRHAIIYGYVANSYEFFSNVFRGGTITISDTKPHLITYTYDGSQFKAYFDGQLVSTTNVTFTLNDAEDNFTYGQTDAYGAGTQHKAQGIRFFNRAISADEIRDWYLEGLRALGGSSLSGLMDGLVAYYDFRGDANDIVGGNDGTVIGATLTTDRFGNPNSAYSFTGGNNIYVGNGTLINNGSNTVSLWVRMDSLSHAVLVVRGGLSVDWGFNIGYHSTTGFSFGTHTAPTDNSISSNFHPNVGEWNHVCAVFNSSSGSMQLYINGTSYGSISCGTTLRSNGTIGWTLGNGNSPASYPLIGGLSDVEIRFTPITANQVKSLYELSKQSKLLPFC